MPFRSAKQRRFMFVKHPEIAKRWVRKYGAKIVPSKLEAIKKRVSK